MPRYEHQDSSFIIFLAGRSGIIDNFCMGPMCLEPGTIVLGNTWEQLGYDWGERSHCN